MLQVFVLAHAVVNTLAYMYEPDFDFGQGTNDPIVPFRYAARIQEFVRPPKSSIIAIEGGKHDVPVTHPEIISHALLDFFMKGNISKASEKI